MVESDCLSVKGDCLVPVSVEIVVKGTVVLKGATSIGGKDFIDSLR